MSFADPAVRAALLDEGDMSGDEASAPPVAPAKTKSSKRGIRVLLHDEPSKVPDEALLFTIDEGMSWGEIAERDAAQADVDSLNIFADSIAMLSRSIKVPDHLLGHVVHDLRSVLCNLHKLRIGRGMDAEGANQLAVDTINICTGLIVEVLKMLPRDIGPEELARVFVFGNAALDRDDCIPRHISVKSNANRINNALLLSIARIVASKLLSFAEHKRNVRRGRETERVYRFSDSVRSRITAAVEKARASLKACDVRLTTLLSKPAPRRESRGSAKPTKGEAGKTSWTRVGPKKTPQRKPVMRPREKKAKDEFPALPAARAPKSVIKVLKPAVKPAEEPSAVPSGAPAPPAPVAEAKAPIVVTVAATAPEPTSVTAAVVEKKDVALSACASAAPMAFQPPLPPGPPPPPMAPGHHMAQPYIPPYGYPPAPPQPRGWVPDVDPYTGMQLVDGMGNPMWRPVW
jgi:hypothetical protein